MSTPDIIRTAKTEAIAFAVERGYAQPPNDTNERLKEALASVLRAEARLEDIVASVPPPEDPANEIECNALDWKRDMIRLQVTRAARAARERQAHFNALETEEDWRAEKERCRQGIAGIGHWFRYWAWAYDPRADSMPVQPFVPFGLYEDDEATFQWEYIEWLQETTFVRRKSGLVEKARDMGATLGWLLWGTANWLWTDYFSALLASANEDLVDSKQDPDTLFEKVRFVLRLQPPQLLPEGFSLDKNMPYMNLANPVNGSTLSGQAPTANAGRQKRRTVVLKDESAAWPHGGYPQNTSLSAVSYSNFDVSSVQGKYNQFHVTATAASVNKFVMDWRDHPWKDKRWYDALLHGFVGPPMSVETIAQEVDRDYDASQPGKVFKDWEETRIVVEWPEVLAYFTAKGYGERFRHVDGSLKIPDDWNWARMQDKGETEGHPRMTLYCAVPAKTWPLSDSVFFFVEHMAPTAADLGTVVRELTQKRRDFHLEERRPANSLISHEAKKDRNIYLSQFGEHWSSWDTDYDSGIGNIRLWIKPVEMHRPNPLRPTLMGRSRMYLVTVQGQGKLLYNEKDQKHFVAPALNDQGFARLRAELPVYHYPPEEAGKPVQAQRPARIFDDAIVCVRAIAVKWGPRPKEESPEEALRRRMAAEQAFAGDQEARDAATLAQQLMRQEYEHDQKQARVQGVGPIGGTRERFRR